MKFNKGVLWEKNPFEINLDYDCSGMAYDDDNLCKHSYDLKVITDKRADGSEYSTLEWKIPAVVIVKNEGGCNSTGLCLQCLIEASQTDVIQQRLLEQELERK